ncbi:MAG: cupredoxin domain-containing protein [Chloroflexota bacterium]|nr:cupredoxin domain-containing protein [Chloroflexota bacterium]
MNRVLSTSATIIATSLWLAGGAWAQQGSKPERHGDQSSPQVVQANLHEWSLGLEGRVVVPGNDAKFEIRNTGSVPHSFELEGKIAGHEVEVVSSVLQPGQSTSLTVRLPAGEYTAYCPIGNHREKGMVATIVFGERKQAGR